MFSKKNFLKKRKLLNPPKTVIAQRLEGLKRAPKVPKIMGMAIFHRPDVAWAVLQTPSSLTDSLNNSLIISSQSSMQFLSQTLNVSKLKFLENVHLPQCIRCQLSDVRCHISSVTCHISRVMCKPFIFFIYFSDKMLDLVGGESNINGTYPVFKKRT